MYFAELGHHYLLRPPEPIGEKSWIENFPASECKASVEASTLLIQAGMVSCLAGVLFFGLRTFTNRNLGLVSLLVALCLPLPGGIPVVVGLILSPKLLYECEFGSCGIPIVAAVSCIAYCLIAFTILKSAVWFVRWHQRG